MVKKKESFPEYGSDDWRAYQYEQAKKANRGHNYEYWSDEKHYAMLDNGWMLYRFGDHSYERHSTASELAAKEIVQRYRKENKFARIVVGYDKNRQRQKRFSVIYKNRLEAPKK